jgi:hypothetical protein
LTHVQRHPLRTLGLFFGFFSVAVLGWGYWHSKTHATLNCSIHDVSRKTDRQAYGRIVAGNVVFMNAAGAVLAEGQIREPHFVLSLTHPEVGDCSRYEREANNNAEARRAWERCFEEVSRWLAAWVREVRYATVTIGRCRIERLPVPLNEYKDSWWIWWVPLPHIGGKPYTYFDISLRVDGLNCRAASP